MKCRPINILIGYFCFLMLPLHSYALVQQDTLPIQKIDRLIQQKLPDIAPGVVVLIARHGNVLYKKAFGKANVKSGMPMQADMAFRIGSITKQFTAVAILKLYQQEKIGLQDTIQKYIKEFPSKEYPITIENLLTHTSGIINYQDIQNPDPTKVKENYTPAQGVDFFKDEPLRFKPGTKFEYSNSNYYLLGYIIENITGKSYQEYLQDSIIKPLGLTHTFYINSKKTPTDQAFGYSRYNGRRWKNAELQNVTYMYAAGALVSNADDLLAWNTALHHKGFISESILDKAFSSYILTDGSISDYGYGWFIRKLDGSITLEHSGSTDGYQTNTIYLPEEDLLVVTLFNAYEADMDWTMLSNDIARLASGKPLRHEKMPDDKILKSYAGTYFFNEEHQLVITYKDNSLYVEAVNPKDRLPRVRLYAKSDERFYIKEAELEFEFKVGSDAKIKLTTYNAHGKDADMIKVK